MENIDSKVFFKEWLETVQSKRDHLLEIWRRPKEFTAQVISGEDSVMKKIADKLGLLCYDCNYYSLDCILYKEIDLVPDRPQNNYWFRDITVAFEHENYFTSGLYKEVSHLLITNSQLKVLVTYPDRNEERELSYLHKIIAGSRYSKAISSDESFLIILGYENDFSWSGFVYKEDNWKIIGKTWQ